MRRANPTLTFLPSLWSSAVWTPQEAKQFREMSQTQETRDLKYPLYLRSHSSQEADHLLSLIPELTEKCLLIFCTTTWPAYQQRVEKLAYVSRGKCQPLHSESLLRTLSPNRPLAPITQHVLPYALNSSPGSQRPWVYSGSHQGLQILIPVEELFHQMTIAPLF